MAGATTTIRQLKNKDTGIDLTVNTFKETKGMIGSTYEYQVMIVSNLSFFKTAKHKDTDNVQFTVLRKFADFEDLYTKMSTKYSGTVFPPLPKKVLMMNEGVAKERRAGLDHIVKYFAMTPKLCTCPVLLEFLGVSSIKAGKFRKMEVSESAVEKQSEKEDQNKSGEEKSEETKNDGEREENENLFDNDEESLQQDEEEDLFADQPLDYKSADDTKIFEDQDFGGAFDEGEGEDLFLPDAKVVKDKTEALQTTEDVNDDLFRIEDNLDDIMQLELRPKQEQEDNIQDSLPAEKVENNEEHIDEQSESQIVSTDEKVVVKSDNKPKPGVKPALKVKPKISAKPTQTIEKRDSSLVGADFDSIQSKHVIQKPVPSAKPKPPLKQKPQLAAKPDLKPKPKQVQASNDNDQNSESNESLQAKEISEDDIMKYIQENESGADDVDLFS